MSPLRLPLILLTFASIPAFAAVKNVSTVAQLQAALSSAAAGDEIVLADGTYAITQSLNCAADGTSAARIVVRAANRYGAKIQFNALEGFKVSAPYWTFDGLDVEGVCPVDDNCEHAFHVTGRATDFVLRDSRVRNFNAQLKVNAVVNGTAADIPHRGLIERNEIYDTRARNTANPTTKLNIDTPDDWIVRDNFIHDFQKGAGDGVSYGSFMKGGGKRGVYERNLVICSRDFTGGTRIGLSFGGGGTGNQYCAPAFDVNVPCDPENVDGVMRNNVIVNCSDVAIYLNKATNSRVLFNTMVGTTGVDYRFTSSTGTAHGNLMTSVVRSRNGGTFTAGTNMENVSVATFDGYYQAPLTGDFGIQGNVTPLIAAAAPSPLVTDDFCGRPRPSTGNHSVGAFEHSLGDCDGGTVVTPDAGVVDAGVIDAGEVDGGDADGGVDAGTSVEDGGIVAPDGGEGGGADGGTVADGGIGEDPEGVAGACGCSATSGSMAALLFAVVQIARRRRDAR